MSCFIISHFKYFFKWEKSQIKNLVQNQFEEAKDAQILLHKSTVAISNIIQS